MNDMTILVVGGLMSLPGIIAVIYMFIKPSASVEKVEFLDKQVRVLEKLLEKTRVENKVLQTIVADQTRRISELESKHAALTAERNRLLNQLRDADETIHHLQKLMKRGES